MSKKEDSKIKKELERRDISVEDLRQFEIYGIATILKEDWSIDEIVEHIEKEGFKYFNLSDNEFIEEVERRYMKIGEGKWFYSKYLDDLEKIVKETKS